MTDLTELRMNVAALKRVDPYVKDILETATHVALYTFNAENNEWEKTDIEGALFVYSRIGEPFNSVLIMNRLNTNNLVEPVTQGLDLQLQEPFLLYRNSKCSIYGIWFYDKEECVRIATMLTKLVKASEENQTINKSVSKGKKQAGTNKNNVDIFSMLSKAQKDFKLSRSGSSSGNADNSGVGNRSPSTSNDNICGPLAAPLGPDFTSQSVMDFFAKAKVNTGHFKPGDQPSPSTVVNEGKPLLARLMSHPAAHTLENIEKQHRSVTPQPSQHQSQQPPNVIPVNNKTNLPGPARFKRRNKTINDIADLEITQVSSKDLPPPPVNPSTNSTHSPTGFLRIQSPTAIGTTPNSTNNKSMLVPSNPNPLASLFGHSTSSSTADDIITTPPALTGNTSAPALIPPVMFAVPTPPEPVIRPLQPLTRNQLFQAFEYLLRNDPDFITKLHEAYVKSLGEILS